MGMQTTQRYRHAAGPATEVMMGVVVTLLLVMAATVQADGESESWRNLNLVNPISYDAAREVAEEHGRPLDDATLHWAVEQPAFAERVATLYRGVQERKRQERLDRLRDDCESGRTRCQAARRKS